MYKSICRPIIFYNNFLPSDMYDRKWVYCAFGIFDGIVVENQIVSENARDILLKIWEHQKDSAYALEGKYTAQTVYAMCFHDEEKEQLFWNNDTLPYTFFCRLQFKSNLDSLRKNISALRNNIANVNNTESMVYETYDNSDLMIVIKAKTYEIGAGMINAMHQDVNFSLDDSKICELKNSFTVFAVKQNYIQRTLEKDFCDELNKIKIDMVSVRIIERKSGKLEELRGTIIDKINAEVESVKCSAPILGTDDAIILFERIGWGDFLKLYCVNEGIFHNSCPVYHSFIASATTTLSTSLPECSHFLPECMSDNDPALSEKENRNKEILGKYAADMLKRVSALEQKQKDIGAYKELYIILNALPKFSEEIFSDYVFFTILNPISTLVELLEERKNDPYYDSYYEFIKCFNMYIQNSVKSDRHTMQAMDFNTKIYDVPVKLNAFYTAYIYRVCEALNIQTSGDEKHSYDFWVVPGVTDIVNVVELFQKTSAQKRLLKVVIPENRFYDVCNNMIIFTHEASHYVSTALRNRKDRYDHVLGSLASIYVNYVKSYLDEEPEISGYITNVAWENTKIRMKQTLIRMLDCEEDEQFLKTAQMGSSEKSEKQGKRIAENNKTYKWHFSFLKQNLYRAMMYIMQDRISNIFGGLAFDRNTAVRKEILDKILAASEHFLAKYEEGTTQMTSDTVLGQINDLYEESFADLMSMALLKLDVKDYLNNIIGESRKQHKDVGALRRTETVYRITLVLDVMSHFADRAHNFRNIVEKGEYYEERISLLRAVEGMKKHIHDGWIKKMQPEEFRKCCVYALLDKAVYKEAQQYLCDCLDEYMVQLQKSIELQEISDKLNELYDQCKNEKNIESQIASMEKFVYEYKEEVYGNLNEIYNIKD